MPESLRVRIKKLHYKGEFNDSQTERLLKLLDMEKQNAPDKNVGWIPKGHWVGIEYDGYADGNPVYDTWECSECGWEHNGADDTLTCYCPNCGAKMEEVQDADSD